MRVALIDYGAGNLRSAARALEAVGAKVDILQDPSLIAKADRIVLPGVGAFADCMAGLKRHDGMIEALQEAVIRRACPFLGVCVGMQLMVREGHEFGTHLGLGWLSGRVERLGLERGKIPHMGWNDVMPLTTHPLLEPEKATYYFVHSFHVILDEDAKDQELAFTDYNGSITAIIARDNMIGTQFHPEKSAAIGLRFLKRFIDWRI